MTSFEDYEKYDGLGLAELVKRGDTTPVELCNAAIERIEERNPKLNAVVHKMYDRARKHAQNDLPDGPFRGVPFLLKDLNGEDKGQPSTWSCRALADWRADEDCELVKRYKKAGVVIVGRTNTPEFGIYAVTESEYRGPARNPWNQAHTTGGSSGGSGAAVASRMVPMAHGGDGGGSIRIPSSHNGLFGLKPTRGRNPMGPDGGEGWSGLVCEHVLTRSVRDSAAMLDATSGPSPGDPYCAPAPKRPFLDEVGADPGKLRIGFTTRALLGDETHPDNVAAVEEAAKLAESLGHSVEEACPEFDKDEMVMAYLITVATCVGAVIDAVADRVGRKVTASDVEITSWLLKLIGDKLSARDFIRARNAYQATGRNVGHFFTRYDVLLTPTTARPPVPIGEFALSLSEKIQVTVLRLLSLKPLMMAALKEMAKGPLTATPNTMLFNMTGNPAMSLPLKWNSDNLPIGTQWVGRFGDDATLFRLAAQIEAEKPWADKLPY